MVVSSFKELVLTAGGYLIIGKLPKPFNVTEQPFAEE